MKKKSFVTVLASLCLLVSCGTKVTYDEATKFCQDNYTLEAATDAFASGTFKTVVKVSKAEGVFEKLAPSDASGDAAVAPTALASVLAYGNNATYTTSGKKLTISYTMNVKDILDMEGVEGEGKGSQTFNEYGLITKTTESVDYKIEASKLGLTVTGALKYTLTTTYTYAKK